MKKSSRRCDPGEEGRRGRAARRPLALPLLVVLLVLAGSAFFLEEGAAAPPAGGRPGAGSLLEPGATAPGFTLRDTAGEPFDFEAEKARSPFLVVFFSMFSEPSRSELAVARRLHERHRGAGWRVVAVALDGEPLRSAVAGFARQEAYAFRVVVDELDARGTFKAADLYGVVEIPTTFVIEKGGRIAFGRKGFVREEELEKFLRPAGKP